MALYDDELFPLGIVPMLTLCDAGLGDVDAHLPALGGVDELGERAALVDVHLQVEHGLFLRQIRKIGREQAFRKAVGWDFGNHQRLRHFGKLMQQVNDFTKGYMECCRHGAISAIVFKHSLNSVEFAVVLLALQREYHLVDKVVDIEKFEFNRRVVDLNGQVVGNVVAECRNGRVVVRAAPFAEEVREAIHKNLSAGLGGVVEEQFLACLFALAVGVSGIAAYQCCLNRTRQHHRAGIAMLLESVEQGRGKAEVAFAEVLGVLGAVDTGEVENKVGLPAVAVEFLWCRVDVVLKDLVDLYRVIFRLAVLDIIELEAKVFSDKTIRSGYKYLHNVRISSGEIGS